MKRNPVVYGMSDETYHGDHDYVSSSSLRLMLREGGPAEYRRNIDNPPVSTATFNTGHIAHAYVLPGNDTALGEICLIDAKDYRTKAAREARDKAFENHQYPMLTHEVEQFETMRDTVMRHESAGRLLRLPGNSEVSLFWEEQGVKCKARPDFLGEPVEGKTLWVADYKTAQSSSREAFRKAIGMDGFNYRMQAEWYMRGIRATGYHSGDIRFIFIVQEKTAPYLVMTYEIGEGDIRKGRDLNDAALGFYKTCVDTDTWPDYSQNIIRIESQPWDDRKTTEAIERLNK